MQFLSGNRCQIFGRFGFLKTESEQNFGFPHIPTSDTVVQRFSLNGKGWVGSAASPPHSGNNKYSIQMNYNKKACSCSVIMEHICR